LLAYEFSRQQVEQFGIRIRSEARLIDGRYAFSETQADHILELRLYQLTGLEREKIANEYGELILRIDDLTNILERADRVMNIIKEELQKSGKSTIHRALRRSCRRKVILISRT